MQNIHATELREKLENGESLHIIDVREQDEYDAGHIPHVPLYPLSEFPEVTEKLAKDNVYHIICRSGGRSVTAGDYSIWSLKVIRSSTSRAVCSPGTVTSKRDA